MRRLDSVLGLPAAWLLGLLPTHPRELPEAPRRVVVVKLFGMGSIVIASGALRALKAAQPQARLTLVTFAPHRELQSLLAVFDEVVPIRAWGVVALVTDALRALFRVRRLRADVVVDLEYFSKASTVFCSLARAEYRLGFLLPARWRRRLLDGGIAFREDIHFGECVARLLEPWGINYHDVARPAISVPPGAERTADALLQDICTDGKRGGAALMLINPHAHEMCPERRWPVDRFAALVDRLAAEHPDAVFGVLGVEAERPASAELRGQVSPAVRGRVHVLAGQTTLPVLAAVLRRARLLVTNDSGILHLGAAVGVSTVALFGPESPLRYGPLAEAGRCRVLLQDVVCGPCLTYMNSKRAPCEGKNICMQRLSVERVADACAQVLADAGGAGGDG